MNETITLLLANAELISAAALGLFAAGFGLYKLVTKLTKNPNDDVRAAEIEEILEDIGLLPDNDEEK